MNTLAGTVSADSGMMQCPLHKLTPSMLDIRYSPMVENALKYLGRHPTWRWKWALHGQIKAFVADHLAKLPPDTTTMPALLYKTRFSLLPLRVVIQFSEPSGTHLPYTVQVMTAFDFAQMLKRGKTL